MKGFLVAGSASGVGKTTVTLALIAAMRRRGLIVQPFKCGPDFLDAGHHTRIAGRTARNLDTWMLSTPVNEDVLCEASAGADLVIVEGMMGLFDGKDGASDRGSSAELAKLLHLPVVLVLDAAKSARSIAAVLLGFERFDPALRLAGVILNRPASERHFSMLETAISAYCETPILGWLPRDSGIAIPERHLGLQTAEEVNDPAILGQQATTLAMLAEKHLQLESLLSLDCGLSLKPASTSNDGKLDTSIRIGVARDQAFSFYYEDNLDLLRRHGAEIVPFSPMTDAILPEDLDALYLGGGYPELHARQLSGNRSMLKSVQTFAASNRPIYAECGGMIYLALQLTTLNGDMHEMAGVLPFSTEMTPKLSKFGYATIELTQDCLLGLRGVTLRGHSFHYSRLLAAPEVSTSYRVQYSLAKLQEDEGFTIGNILASYIHIHFRTQLDIARSFIQSARAIKEERHTLA